MMQSTPTFVAVIIGKRRAEAVFEALVYTNKVPENRVRLFWTGEHLPYVSTADEQAESQNRMVAIIVGNDPSSCQ
jgi:outer membrane protein OmpA-like peptidoglycan-associated protein